MARYPVFPGAKIGRLIVVKEVARIWSGGKRYRAYMCNCDCGTAGFITRGASLARGMTLSCGCLQREQVRAYGTKHGHAARLRSSASYNALRNAMQRCLNSDNKYFEN